MRQCRILNAEPFGYCDAARTVLRQLGEVVEVPLSRAALLSQLPDYDVLIVRLAHQIDHAVVDAGRRLKAIVTPTTGLDHIDLEYAQSRGITVLSLRGELQFLRTVSATAEHTWALLLALLHRLPQAFAAVRGGDWDRDKFRGNEVTGKRLGIVGLGRIGHKMARYGFAFEMEVSAYDPYALDWIEGVRRFADLDQLLRWCNILSLHVPLSEKTRRMIGADALALLPPGSVLINTSRGEIVDETALVQSLEQKHLAGAALDVITHEREPALRQLNPLIAYARTHDNLIITPHISGATQESMAKTEVFMAHKLAAFLENVQAADVSTKMSLSNTTS